MREEKKIMYKLRDFFQNGITIFVIFLLLSIGFTSIISAKEETQEYTLMIPSIFGIKQQKISFTSEQSDKLDSIFDELHNQLKDVDSVEETKLLYKRTIDTLVDNNLLSKSNAFLTKKLLFSDFVDRFYSALNKNLDANSDLIKHNCWVTGEATNTNFLRPIVSRWLDFGIILSFLMIIQIMIRPDYANVFFADISFGYYWELDHGRTNAWSNGSILAKNRFGSQELSGVFRGGLSTINALYTVADIHYYFVGIYFFLGLGYYNFFSDENYFMGRASVVNVYEKPDF